MMLNINKLSKLSIAAIALMSSSAMASTSYADFSTVSDPSNGASNFNSFSVLSNGVTVSVSGWSDTDDMGNGNPLSGDDKITEAVDFDQHPLGGWAMTNEDEINTGNCGYHHSADNLGDTCGYQDFDMFLVEFSEAVNLSSATYAWNYGATSNNQVTVAALNDNTLLDKDWGEVLSDQTIASGYSQMNNVGGVGGSYYVNDATVHYTNFDNTSNSNTSGVYSNYWLIGALNSVFGGDVDDEGNDGLKLSGVSFTQGIAPPPTTVPEPASIMMFGLALAGFAVSRRKAK